MYKLRDYQQKASDAAVSFFANKAKKNNAIMVLPTGAGKSLVIADIAARLNGHTLVFQPSKEILEQNYLKLCSYGVLDCSIYSASFGRKEISRITFATIGSVINHPELFQHFQNIIIDECHLVNPKEGMYKSFLSILKCKVLGLTATPYRLSSSRDYGSMLKFITRTRPCVFSEVIYQVQISTLLDMGYLAKLDYYAMNPIGWNELNLKVNTKGADYTDKSVVKEYERIDFYGFLVSIVQRLLNPKSGVKRKGILVFTRFLKEAGSHGPFPERPSFRVTPPRKSVRGFSKRSRQAIFLLLPMSGYLRQDLITPSLIQSSWHDLQCRLPCTTKS